MERSRSRLVAALVANAKRVTEEEIAALEGYFFDELVLSEVEIGDSQTLVGKHSYHC